MNNRVNKHNKELIDILGKLETEKPNSNTANIDKLSPLEIAQKINDEDKTVASVVEQALPEISKAAEVFANAIKTGGRVIYIGAGTSGRLGVLDAAECPPTFGTDPRQIIGLISGGYDTLILSKEGVEDQTTAAVKDLKKIDLSQNDLLIGIAASIRTPYTLAGIEYAKSINAKTALIVCNRADILTVKPDILIELHVGPEAITGSTRMKSGTAQKMALNMISTTAMVLLGKTYGNLMVDLKATSEKLAARSRKILIETLGVDYDTADELLKKSDKSVKTAIVMQKLSVTKDEALRKIEEANGFIDKLIG